MGLSDILVYIFRRIFLLPKHLIMCLPHRFAGDYQSGGLAVSPVLRRAAAECPDFDPYMLHSQTRIRSWWPGNPTLEARRLLDLDQNIRILDWCKHGDLG